MEAILETCPLCNEPIRPKEETITRGDEVLHLRCYEKMMGPAKDQGN